MSASHPHDPNWQRFGERLTILRRRSGKSASALAQEIGTSHTTIRRLESGDSGIGFDIVYRVLSVLGRLDIPIGDLGSDDNSLP
jgi:transcriptional regulator with XRE-family HTH domain